MFLNDENNKTFLKKLAKRRYTVLLLMKALLFIKNLDNRPKERKNIDRPFRFRIDGKNLARVKFKDKIVSGLWILFLSRLKPFIRKLYFFVSREKILFNVKLLGLYVLVKKS